MTNGCPPEVNGLCNGLSGADDSEDTLQMPLTNGHHLDNDDDADPAAAAPLLEVLNNADL